MKFVSMAAIVKFDDMYAASLYEEKMMEAAGKNLPIEYKNYMGSEYELAKKEHVDHKHVDGDEGHKCDHELRDLDTISNPRKGHFSLMFLRVIYKIVRMYFVCFNYYFAAFLAIICTMLINEAH